MITETNQRIVKVHFKDDGFWDNGCDCCENTYMDTPISTLNKLFKLNRRITTFFIHNDADRM